MESRDQTATGRLKVACKKECDSEQKQNPIAHSRTDMRTVAMRQTKGGTHYLHKGLARDGSVNGNFGHGGVSGGQLPVSCTWSKQERFDWLSR